MLCLSMESYFVDLVKPAAASTKPSNKGVTFRLSTEKLEQLRRAADARNISSNTLFNQILKAYLDWHSMAAHAKLYYLPKSFLVRLLNELTNDELDELARDVPDSGQRARPGRVGRRAGKDRRLEE